MQSVGLFLEGLLAIHRQKIMKPGPKPYMLSPSSMLGLVFGVGGT